MDLYKADSVVPIVDSCFSFEESPKALLKRYFHYDDFVGAQEKIVNSIISGRDTMCVMPTGGGKSLCYQLPALYFAGVTLVISPLIALMNEQVDFLNANGIPSVCVNSSKSKTFNDEAMVGISEGKFKLIYVAPERLPSKPFRKAIANLNISFVAVDEAHCISQWGHDFRPSYLGIPNFINSLRVRPVIGAYTATATEDTREDMLHCLRMDNPLVEVSGFDRPNLFFDVQKPSDKNRFLREYLAKHSHESGIVYCNTRKQVDMLHYYLGQRGFNVLKYHAGMETEDRNTNQERFMKETSIMVATIAFGMGINKPDIRFVLHYAMPENLENYYQAAGRAGRDGKSAECIILYSPRDVDTIEYFIEHKQRACFQSDEDYQNCVERDTRKMVHMMEYCETRTCYREYILKYFGDKTPNTCDNCGNCSKVHKNW